MLFIQLIYIHQFEDYPAIFAYIRKSTRQPNFYIVTHSQGGSSIMALLSEYPEYNAQIHAINMMAPLGYIGHSKLLNISTNLVAQLTHVIHAFRLRKRGTRIVNKNPNK